MDWRLYVAALAISAALTGLITWQFRGIPEKCRNWLGISALTLEALAMAMAVFWAVRQGVGILTLFFAGGFIGLTLSKAVTVSALVYAFKNQKLLAGSFILAAMIGAYLTVYGAGVFEGTLHSASQHNEAAIKSAPVQALDSNLEVTRSRLNSLDESIDAQIAEAQTRLNACPSNYFTKCINPAKSRIADLEASRDSKRMRLQENIASLEERRADLLSSGGAATDVASADDRLIAWVFGLDSVEQAAGIKWLIFVAVFDILSLLLRLAGDLLLGNDVAGAAARKIRALIDSGLSVQDAAFTMAGQPAKVRPALSIGGRIDGDGLSEVHGGEVVLNSGATKELDQRYPGMLDELNQRHAKEQRVGNVSVGKSPLSAVKEDLSAVNNITAGSNISTLTQGKEAVSVRYNGVERVPAELSQCKGKGRVGKVDTCIKCGDDFIVKTYNAVKCQTCSNEAKASYYNAKIRKR